MLRKLMLRASVGAVVVAGSVLAWSGIAGAVPYNPTTSLTSFATGAGTLAGPIIVAVAVSLIGLAVLFWGVRFVYGLLTSGGRVGRR